MSESAPQPVDRVTRVARLAIWTPLGGWLLLPIISTVSVFNVTMACALVAACLILCLPAVGAARQALREKRKKAFAGALIGAILCALTGIAGLAILVFDSSKSGGPWRDARSIGPYCLALFLAACYFIPLFRTLMARPAMSRSFFTITLALTGLALAAPLPVVSDTWTRLLQPELWQAREKRRSFYDFLEQRGYWGRFIPASTLVAAELRIPDGQTLDGLALQWLIDHFPDLVLHLEVQRDARVEPAAREILPKLDIRNCSYFPPDPNGAFLASIAQCPNLETLMLYGASPTPMDFQAIAAAGKLRHLKVWNSHQRDGELEFIAALPNLESLELSGSLLLTDAGLRHLAGMTQLRTLELRNHRIKGPGLRHLHGLGNLERVWLLQEEGLDPAAIEELKVALPGCTITVGR